MTSNSQSWIIDRYAAMVSELGLNSQPKISKSTWPWQLIEDNGNSPMILPWLEKITMPNLLQPTLTKTVSMHAMSSPKRSWNCCREPGNDASFHLVMTRLKVWLIATKSCHSWFLCDRQNQSTFSRGGSDTGSIIAAGVKADLYENFTDVMVSVTTLVLSTNHTPFLN